MLVFTQMPETADERLKMEEIFHTYGNLMFHVANKILNNDHDAEDAVQEAVFSAWRNIHTLNETLSFKGWLFKILSNRCKTDLMKKNKAPDTLPVEDYTFFASDGEFSFDSAELKEALMSLTPPDGQIILLSVIGGFTSNELAEIYGMPASTIRSRQKRALEKLKVILS